MRTAFNAPSLFQRLTEKLAHLGRLEDALELHRVSKRTGQVGPESADMFDRMLNSLAAEIDRGWRDHDLSNTFMTMLDMRDDLSADHKAAFDAAYESWILKTAIMPGDSAKLTSIETEGRARHATAAEAQDWTQLKGWLADVMDVQREAGESVSKALGLKTPLDGMLAIWSPGFAKTDIDAYFRNLRAELPPLVEEAQNLQKTSETPDVLRGPFPSEQQKSLNRKLAAAAGMDFTRGDIVYSKNAPVEGGIRDMAIANLPHPDPQKPFYQSLKSALHEAGHEIYIQNLPEGESHLPVGGDLGGVMHESQALLYDMIIGRSREFSRFIAKEASDEFGRDIDADQLYRLRTQINHTHDRKLADELTYHLHVMARWQAYADLFESKISIDEYPDHLASLYREIVGIEADPTALALADVHMFVGKGALYPSYTLGHGLAAQLWSKLQKECPNWQAQLESGDLGEITGWLAENIHMRGSRYAIPELMEKATGAPPDPSYQIDYLRARYGRGVDQPKLALTPDSDPEGKTSSGFNPQL